ncbi:TetR/AcrR family transcriptional regulator [Pseudonocardia alaniniphila]|uniref:TetR/AcrR family transcriptional regulator n=1 Tax=Pseudonocardia alaniniphila TaxID=75291 RepID=A0ABS9T8U8_9PSEU|nr:TetR/AcrR family transcriptional regulator [Pseudonocardia alaniniphila]MCH6164969.1 TetR/AcrR family transcriptional regulator [Pseudonocardia alaniniphila]
MTEPRPGLRERKKQRTRRVLIETAYRLFEQDGYERTTVARIAEAADISIATFFNYFPSKEELLFPEGTDILNAGLEVIAGRSPEDDPVDLLTLAVHAMISSTRTGTRDPASELETRRLRLVMSVPTLRATMLERAFSALQGLAGALRSAYPTEFDEVDANAIVGAVFGAGLAAASVSIQQGQPSDAALTRSIELITQALQALRRSSS